MRIRGDDMSKNYRTPEFEAVLTGIENADDSQITDIIRAVVCRYRKLFPDWQAIFLSVPSENEKERMESILQMLEFLKVHKTL